MNLVESVDSRLQSGKSKKLYDVQDPVNKVFKRNPNCWAYDIDLTCASPWNTFPFPFGGNLRAGTLFTRSHVALASHFAYGKGVVLTFVSRDDVVHEREVVAAGPVGASDMWIGVLDSPVPDDISPAALARPATLKEIKKGTPALFFDQEENVLVGNFLPVNGWVTVTPIKSGPRKPFYEPAIHLDSGNPIFAVRDNNPILLSHFYSGGGGPNYAHMLPSVLKTMQKLDAKRYAAPTLV